MAKREGYATRYEREQTPSADGRQYRAKEVKLLDDRCPGCAASAGGTINMGLCNALPECTKSKRLDGRNVVFVDCGPVLKAPEVTPVYNAKGAVRYEHDAFKTGTSWLHKPTGDIVEVVDDGVAGMPEIKFGDGSTTFAYPQDLKPFVKGGAE